MTARLRIGTRDSALALWQANTIQRRLKNSGQDSELHPLKSQADKNLKTPLGEFNVSGVFTKELERGLLEKQIDLAVHSAKDLASRDIPGLKIAAFLEADSPHDVLVSFKHPSLTALPHKAKIGCGSPRRMAQLLQLRADLQLSNIRGNLQRRLEKANSEFDAIVLAKAGLKRLDLSKNIVHHFSVEEMVPAHGQGILAIQCREEDVEKFLALRESGTHERASLERQIASRLELSCSSPNALHLSPKLDEPALHYFFANPKDLSKFTKGILDFDLADKVAFEQVFKKLENEYRSVQ